MTALVYLLACACGKSVDRMYKDLKIQYEGEARLKRERAIQIEKIMKENKFIFRGDAWKMLRKQEAERLKNSVKNELGSEEKGSEVVSSTVDVT